MKAHEVAVPRTTLAWLVEVAEGTYVDQSGMLSPQQTIEYQVHVPVAHAVLGTENDVVLTSRKAHDTGR